jgi:chromosome segregation ATPase
LLIEDQLSIVDETNNDSLTDISSSIQFLDKEIRKLWDLSNKRNKVNIQNLTSQTAEIETLLSKIEEDIKSNQAKLKLIEQNLNSNITKVRDLQLTADELAAYKLNLNNIDTQLILLEDSVQALNNYKNQLNQVILEIQTEITIIQNSQDIE